MRRFAQLLALATATIHSSSAEAVRVYSSSRDILSLSRTKAAAAHPAELRGVVTLAYPDGRRMVVQDSDGGVFVTAKNVTAKNAHRIAVGDLVLVKGRTGPGGFAPILTDAVAEKLGRRSLPPPQQITFDQMLSYTQECKYVEVEAVVRSVFPTGGRWQVNLSLHGQRLPAMVQDGSQGSRPQPGDAVRVRGIASAVFNNKAQWLGPRLLVQAFRDITVIRANSHDHSRLPITQVGELLTYSTTAPVQPQIRVRGAVTCIGPDGSICLQEGSHGLIIGAGDTQKIALNDVVEAAGFPAFDSYSPKLEDAVLRPTGQSRPVAPLPITSVQAQSGKHDGQLVEMTGDVLFHQRLRRPLGNRSVEIWSLTLQSGNQAVTAELMSPPQDETLLPAAGSKVRVVGICHITSPPSVGSANTFVIRMRQPSDLFVVQKAPWWTLDRAQSAVIALGAAVVLGLVWLGALRRKVTRQRSIIQGQLQLETALAQRYRDLFENSTDLVFTIDMAGTFVAMNSAAKSVFGFDGDTGSFALQSFLPSAERRVLKDIFGVLLGGERSVLKQMNILSRQGQELVLEMNCRLRHGKGAPTAIDIIARDVTQQRREQAAVESARAAAEAASRAKSEFLANMSHEIRTPMNGILGMTDLTLESQLTDDQRTNLQVVRTSAEALLTIINDILDFSKIEAGRMDLEQAPFSIAQLVEGCLDLVSLPAAQKGIELVCDLDPSLPAEWIGDAARLRQVLTNLAGNAVKFTHSGEILVRIERVAGPDNRPQARFLVRDTGIGIPKEHHERIFQMFCQADGSTSRRYGGTGLGLAIASRLVHLMGGQLTLTSVPGEGSSFAFTLDLQTRHPEPLVKPGALAGTTIRIVEANASAREALTRTLVYAGGEVVSEGPAAFALTADHRSTDAPVLLLQAPAPATGEDPGKRQPMSVVLRKPAPIGVLLKAIQSTLTSHSVLMLEAGSRLPEVEKAPPSPAIKGTILLAEDNKVNQFLAVRTLEKDGYRVLVANNGLEAVKTADQALPDLVLMDIQMPEMDGFQATAKILKNRERRGEAPIPVIAMTAHALKGDRERCLSNGMTDYISKPVRPADLLAMVDRHMQKAMARVS